MDDNNNFLNSYKKKMDGEGQAQEQSREVTAAKDEQPSFKYEEKSGFVKPPQRGRAAIPPPKSKTRFIVPAIIGVVVVVGIIIGLAWYLNRGTVVIDLTNWTVNDAQLWAKDSNAKLQVGEEYNDQFEAGKIVSQSPVKGTTIAKGGFLKITVSLGHDLSVTLPLPDLMSMTKDEIDAWASDNFMIKVRITTEYSEEVASGKVISYEINDNTVVSEVKRNTPVYVIVSKGKEDLAAVLITVPNFREKTISESYVFANENGITLKVVEQYDDYAPKGAIISQSVKADEKIKKGDEITLNVSKGKKIAVPDFSGYSKQKATAEATELAIPVSIIEKYSSKPTGSFISQSIEVGSVYEDGDVLELAYSLGNKIVISDFVGQTRDAIETWAKDLNAQGASITIKVTNTKSNSPKGKIIYQNISNTLIGVKATIKITVSLGKVVYVPDFVAPSGSGYDVAITREKAIAMCEALNIIPVFVAKSSTGRLPGEIWYQSVPAGSEITEESIITLRYVPANTKITVPNFTNMTKEQIIVGNYYKMLDITFVVADANVEGYENTVFKQSILASTRVVSGSAITLTISPESPTPTVTPTPTP